MCWAARRNSSSCAEVSRSFRSGACLLVTVILAVRFGTVGPLQAQSATSLVAARCPAPVPAPFSEMTAPAVTIRLMAEGQFPAPEVAAARALVVLIRDVLIERAPVEVLSSIDVQRRIVPSIVTANDLRGLPRGGRLLTAMVRRIGDSVLVIWNLRSIADRPVGTVQLQRVTTRIDDLARAAVTLADAAARASVASVQSIGTATPSLGSVEAGESYIFGLAEALSATPTALRRSRAALTKAASLASNVGDIPRWLARVEYAMIEWNRDAGPNELKGLQLAMLTDAKRAVELAPRSSASRSVFAMANLMNGKQELAEATASEAMSLDAGSPELARLTAALLRVRGDDARALDHLRKAARMSPRDGPLLVELARLARMRNDPRLACYALNAAISADQELAPAYAMRALVRGALGERRSAWADAETATQLGHPEWGERVGAILDKKYGVVSQAAVRLRPLGGLDAKPTNYLDALFLGEVSVALAQQGVVPRLVTALPCTDLRRAALLRDFKVIGASIADTCARKVPRAAAARQSAHAAGAQSGAAAAFASAKPALPKRVAFRPRP